LFFTCASNQAFNASIRDNTPPEIYYRESWLPDELVRFAATDTRDRREFCHVEYYFLYALHYHEHHLLLDVLRLIKQA